MSINRVVISGYLSRDPELRSTASGTTVLGLGVNVTDRRRNPQTGEWENHPNFVDCTMFGARAQGISQYLTKDTKVCIEGKLRWSQWERDGQKRSKLEVIVDEIEFMSPRNSGGDGFSQEYNQSQSYQQTQPYQQAQQTPQYQQQSYQQPVQPAQNPIPPAPDLSVYDEEIPF